MFAADHLRIGSTLKGRSPMQSQKSQPRFSTQRRAALLSVLGTLTVPFAGSIAAASTYPELRLRLYNLHTTEHLDTVFWADGKYDMAALDAINKHLRDHRTGEIRQIDPRLMSILYLINQKLGNNKEISVISGYRSPETNRKLALNNAGVAKNSYHVKGRAIDVRIPGRDTTLLRDAAMNLRVGGVGYYQKSNFTHIDTGPHRHWEG